MRVSRHSYKLKTCCASEGTSREEIGRDAFLERTWAWKEEYGSRIIEQLRKLGTSADWDRERFTLDEGLSRAVREAFVQLYERELIYRGTYLINWSPNLQTAVSDLEVEREEEAGMLYYFRYPIKDSDETIPGRHNAPGDHSCRYSGGGASRGRAICGNTSARRHWFPMLNREVPIIADEYVGS